MDNDAFIIFDTENIIMIIPNTMAEQLNDTNEAIQLLYRVAKASQSKLALSDVNLNDFEQSVVAKLFGFSDGKVNEKQSIVSMYVAGTNAVHDMQNIEFSFGIAKGIPDDVTTETCQSETVALCQLDNLMHTIFGQNACDWLKNNETQNHYTMMQSEFANGEQALIKLVFTVNDKQCILNEEQCEVRGHGNAKMAQSLTHLLTQNIQSVYTDVQHHLFTLFFQRFDFRNLSEQQWQDVAERFAIKFGNMILLNEKERVLRDNENATVADWFVKLDDNPLLIGLYPALHEKVTQVENRLKHVRWKIADSNLTKMTLPLSDLQNDLQPVLPLKHWMWINHDCWWIMPTK